jgi:GAF domain-containing protein
MVNVQLYNPHTKRLEIVVQRGFTQDFLDHFSVVAEDSSACGRALQRGERVIIDDVERDPGFAPHRQIAAAAGFRTVQSTPLVSRSGEPLGMLSTHFRHPHRPPARELRLTDLYARQATETIERERVEEALRRSVERLLTTIREREAVESALQHQRDELRASEHRLATQYAITCILAEADTLADAMPRLLQAIGECLA